MTRNKACLFIKICVFTIIVSLLLSFNSFAADGAIGWYCKRNKEHKQPPLDPQLSIIEKYDGYYVDKNHGDDDTDKVVYLTFDAGYENGNVEKILDAMKEEDVKGAFFVLGNLIERNPELVEKMIKDGHLVCNHTNKHRDMTKCSSIDEFRQELESLETLYSEKFETSMPKYFRPPEGKFSETSMQYAKELGYKTIFWSIAYADWDNNKQMSNKAAKEKIMSNLHNGAVILLHPTSATNASIMKELIRDIKAQGYRFGTLDELTKES